MALRMGHKDGFVRMTLGESLILANVCVVSLYRITFMMQGHCAKEDKLITHQVWLNAV